MDWIQVLVNWQLFSDMAYVAFVALGEATGFGEAFAYFAEVLMGQFMTLLFLVTYPFIWAITILQAAILAIFDPFIGLINAIFGIGNMLVGLVNVFQGVFPTPWLTAMMAIVGINIGLRILKLLGGIEILGFSIGRGQ